VGEYELSLLAADRAVARALEADEPILAGAAARNLAMILSARGRIHQARAVVDRALEDRRPRLDRPAASGLAVYGGLHLLGVTEAARDDDPGEAHRLPGVAAGVAALTGETNHFRMVFGPTDIALHRVSTAVELGRTGEALTPAEHVVVHGAPRVSARRPRPAPPPRPPRPAASPPA
jgi:hypothetical protein